jgi:hypothetical protein
MKNRGPRTDLWGTPVCIFSRVDRAGLLEVAVWILTTCVRSDKNEAIQLIAGPLIPREVSLLIRV